MKVEFESEEEEEKYFFIQFIFCDSFKYFMQIPHELKDFTFIYDKYAATLLFLFES